MYSPLLESGLWFGGSLGLGIGADVFLEECVQKLFHRSGDTTLSDLSPGLRCWTLGFGQNVACCGSNYPDSLGGLPRGNGTPDFTRWGRNLVDQTRSIRPETKRNLPQRLASKPKLARKHLQGQGWGPRPTYTHWGLMPREGDGEVAPRPHGKLPPGVGGFEAEAL